MDPLSTPQKYQLPIQLISFILFALFCLLQFQFLFADPDLMITLDRSRGPFTDEGLYSIQVRNLINHGKLGMEYTDGTAKTPLFSLLLYIYYSLVGTEFWLGRILILGLSWIGLFFVLKAQAFRPLFPLLLLIGGSNFAIFHFSHFCMVELLSTVSIFTALIWSSQVLKDKSPYRSSILAATFISIAYYLKIQFVYVLPILPLSILLTLLYVEKETRAKLWKHFLVSGFTLFAFFILFLIGWYLPNKDLFDHILSSETAGRLASWSQIPGRMRFTFNFSFWNQFQWLNSLFFILSTFIGLYLLWKRKISQNWAFLFISIGVWAMLESHKFLISYQPTRYFISCYFMMIAVIVIVFYQFFTEVLHKKYVYVGLFLITTPILIKNGIDLNNSYSKRSFQIQKIDNYLARYDLNDQLILGAWAPSLTWKSKAKVYPVWKDYFNDKNTLNRFKPRIIIEEVSNTNSAAPYKAEGIDLNEYADSSRLFTVGVWKLQLFWMKKSVYQNTKQ